jgi:hypothetical protein
MRKFALLGLFGAFSFAAAGATLPRCRSLEVVGVQESKKPALVPVFSARKAADVTLRLTTDTRMTGSHHLEWRLFTPSGNLYQSLVTPVGDTPGTREVPGYPDPLEVAISVPVELNRWKLEKSFPIGGTMIGTGGLYGEWRLETILDGAPYCGTARFRIEP